MIIKSDKIHKLGAYYFRHLVSYMTVLLIPLIILTFFYSSRFMKKFYEEIYETVDLELVQTSTRMDNELKAMQNIISQLTLSKTIHQVSRTESPLELRSVITSLSSYTASNLFIEDIVLFLDNSDYAVTSSTTCRDIYFFNQYFPSSTLDPADFHQFLQSGDSPLFIPTEKMQYSDDSSEGASTLLLSYPLYTDYQKREGTALFKIKNSAVQELFSKKLQTYQAQLYILSPDGTVITTSGSDDVMRPFLAERSGQALPHLSTASIGREDYVIRSYRSDASQWTYVAFIPDKQTTFSQVSDIMKEFIAAIIIILLLSSFTIFFLQKINYTPMRRLRDKAKQISPTGTTADELATISNALDYLSEQNTTLSSQLEGTLTAVKNERLYRLLGGNYADREEFNLDCCELDLCLEYDRFNVGIIMLHTAVNDLDLLAQEMKKYLNVSYMYYYINYLQPTQIVLLFNLPEHAAKLSKLYQEVQTWLTKKQNIPATIGIGSITDSTERIAQSYMEAASALDYRFVKGNGTLIEFREVLGFGRIKVVYPNQEFEILRHALLSRNEQNIRSAIQNIIQFMEQQQLPLYLARSICFDLIHLVNEHMQSRKNAAANSPLELTGMETALEIIEMLRDWSEHLAGFTSSARQIELEDVLRFLDDNCLQCDFSAFETAQHFDMTLPAFSKYFKDSYGQNVMDYTIHKRMEKAKELLKDTDIPLKNISEQVGYYNISSFTRRFKLNQGVTPGDYRKIVRNG